MNIKDFEKIRKNTKDKIINKCKKQQKDKRFKITVNENDIDDVVNKNKNFVCCYDGKKYIDIKIN